MEYIIIDGYTFNYYYDDEVSLYTVMVFYDNVMHEFDVEEHYEIEPNCEIFLEEMEKQQEEEQEEEE